MKIQVKVKANSKIEKIEQISPDSFEISVKVPPIEGRANERIIEMLAKHFKISKSKISLIRGLKSKQKVFLVDL